MVNSNLLQAREHLRNKLFYNAEKVVNKILDNNLDNLIEIGIFGSLAKDKFNCNSDTDIYLLFDGHIPDRKTKGEIRSIAEENNCDIVFITKDNIIDNNPSLLVINILEERIILWRR